jgi:hypothetical protein
MFNSCGISYIKKNIGFILTYLIPIVLVSKFCDYSVIPFFSFFLKNYIKLSLAKIGFSTKFTFHPILQF